jgi:hypothetical protein
MQRFRGDVYVTDGAIQPSDLTKDGRHSLPIDEDSWHVLTLRSDGTVCACLRFLRHRMGCRFDHLVVRHSALMQSPVWAPKLKKAAEAEMEYAERERISFGEVGGWAIAPDRRLSTEPLRTLLATYGLLGMLGGCCGLATATHRHGSASILQRVGLSPLVVDDAVMPAYYDPRYRCEMEVLRFDSRIPNPRFRGWIAELAAALAQAPVICGRGMYDLPARQPQLLPFGSPRSPVTLATQ